MKSIRFVRVAALGFAFGAMPETEALAEPPAAEPPRAFVVPEVTDVMLEPPASPPHRLESFEQARDLLERRSPDLAQARADVEKARGVLRQTFAGILPTFNGTASFTAKPLQPNLIANVAPPNYGYLTQLVATERVVAPSTWRLIGANERDVERAELSALDARRRVYAGLAEALLGVVVTEQTAERARDGLRAAMQTLALWSKRKELGVGTDLDLARLAQDVATARLSVIERHESVHRAREALGMALGASEAWGVGGAVDPTAVQAAVRRACTPLTSPLLRADVESAAAQLEVNQRLVKKSELDFAPTVDLVTTVGMQPSSFTSTTPAANVQIAGVLSWSIWDGGSRYGALRIARANVASAEAKHDKIRREAELQAQQTSRAIGVAEQALLAATDARDRARDTDRLVRVALAAGSGSTLDLVQAQQQLRRAETETALREFELVRTKVEQFLVSSRCAP